jgi:MoaA/NifB/PqqE/SkfB family radical SAM enzyme
MEMEANLMTRNLYFEATNCRNQCFHCYCQSDQSGREMIPPDQLIAIAKEFRDRLNEPVAIHIFKEPTLYPDLVELLKEAEGEGLLVEPMGDRQLFTNGEKLSEELLEGLYPLCRRIVFTLFGTKNNHDALAGRMGAYQRIEQATQRARQAGFEVTWRILATKGSEADLKALVQRGQDLLVDQIEITAHYYISGAIRNALDNIPTAQTVERIKALDLDVDLKGARPEREFAADPALLQGIDIPKLKLAKLYIGRSFHVYPLNQIEDVMRIGNYMEDKDLLFDRLTGKANMPGFIRRALQVSMTDLAKAFASPYSDMMLTPQMLFDKYYLKMDL